MNSGIEKIESQGSIFSRTEIVENVERLQKLEGENEKLKRLVQKLKFQINEHVQTINRLSILESALAYAREESKSEKEAMKKVNTGKQKIESEESIFSRVEIVEKLEG